MVGDEDSHEPIVVEYGGRITPVDFVVWPAFGLLPALAMIPALPRWLAYICLALGVVTTCALMIGASITFGRENAWIEGSRLQLSLMIGFFLIGQAHCSADATQRRLSAEGTSPPGRSAAAESMSPPSAASTWI